MVHTKSMGDSPVKSKKTPSKKTKIVDKVSSTKDTLYFLSRTEPDCEGSIIESNYYTTIEDTLDAIPDIMEYLVDAWGKMTSVQHLDIEFADDIAHVVCINEADEHEINIYLHRIMPGPKRKKR